MQALRRNFGGKSAVQAWWRQFGGKLVQARVFSMTVQYSAVTVQYSVHCIVGIQCDQLYVMFGFSCDLSWNIFGVRVHIIYL